ncbi:MAG: glycine cleavage system aminomethyltransferase GcvT [Bacteroidota bacterium]
MQRTPIYPIYTAYGARVVEFAGWELPVQFAGIAAEHRAVRNGAGLFDVSHMGEFGVFGREALAFLQHVLVNDCAKLTPGRIIYSPMCYPDGGCVDDLLVYMLAPGEYMLVVNAANTGKDFAWLSANKDGYAVTLTDLSPRYAQLALQGPAAAGILDKLTGGSLPALKYYRFAPHVAVAGYDCLLSRTGYTGEDGFEFYIDPKDAVHLWDAILASGAAVPVGLGARDTLRLEAGMPLYGHELSPSISPIEAGLSRFVALNKPDFVGREALLRQAESGPDRLLAGLVLDERGVPRAGYPVLAGGRRVGTVTSGTISPHTEQPIAMALLERAALESALPISVVIRDKEYPAHRVNLPFYQRISKV